MLTSNWKTLLSTKANFLRFKLEFRKLFSSFDYIPLSCECIDFKTLLQLTKIIFYACSNLIITAFCFLSLLFKQSLHYDVAFIQG